MRSEKEIKLEICRLFRLRESAQLRHDVQMASLYLREIHRLERGLGDKPDSSWAAFQRYLLDT